MVSLMGALPGSPSAASGIFFGTGNDNMVALETERLILRRFSPGDWTDLYEYLSDEEAVRYEPYGVFDEQETRREAALRSKQEAFRAVCLKSTGKMIGNVYFRQRDPKEYLTWELGYVFNPAYWGKGYATESCRAVLRYAFEQRGVRRVVALCNPLNTGSWKLLGRLNMRREGCLVKNVFYRRDVFGRPLWQDTYEYAILSDEWESGRGL
jgi:RimJ/RimL family protein N-acetyltransferase